MRRCARRSIRTATSCAVSRYSRVNILQTPRPRVHRRLPCHANPGFEIKPAGCRCPRRPSAWTVPAFCHNTTTLVRAVIMRLRCTCCFRAVIPSVDMLAAARGPRRPVALDDCELPPLELRVPSNHASSPSRSSTARSTGTGSKEWRAGNSTEMSARWRSYTTPSRQMAYHLIS